MTSDDTGPAGRGRQFATVPVLGAGLVGLALGALATFAVTGLVWTVRVELPPPPYPPPLSSTAPQGCLTPAPPRRRRSRRYPCRRSRPAERGGRAGSARGGA